MLSVTWMNRMPCKVTGGDYVCLLFLAKVTPSKVMSYQSLNRPNFRSGRSQEYSRICNISDTGVCGCEHRTCGLSPSGFVDIGGTQGKVSLCISSQSRSRNSFQEGFKCSFWKLISTTLKASMAA
jgi:hypothetical protein